MPFARHWSLDPEITYLNHGSFGACPRAVQDFQQSLRAEMERGPVRFLWRLLPERIDSARRELATFLNTDPATLAFVPNATTAVNAVVRSLDWRAGDEILTTNHAYNACRNVLDAVCARSGARVVVAEIPFPSGSADEIFTSILDAATPRTRLALIDHVASATSIVFPVARIIRELEKLGIDTLVDGAHAPGFLPLDLGELRPAWYTGNLHKWVCAPKGSAFLQVREDLQSAILPATISHGHNTPRPGSTPFHDAFDWTGTSDPTAWLSVPEAIRHLASLHPGGWDGIRHSNNTLLSEARELLCRELPLEPSCPPGLNGAMTTLPLPRGTDDPAALHALQLRLYDVHRIEVPLHRFAGRGWFRITAQLYNSLDDYRRLAAALAAETAE